jgi:hypothetical protein
MVAKTAIQIQVMKMKLRSDKKTKPFLLRLSVDQLTEIRSLADKYADGNMTKWVRYAALHFKPAPRDLSSEEVY